MTKEKSAMEKLEDKLKTSLPGEGTQEREFATELCDLLNKHQVIISRACMIGHIRVQLNYIETMQQRDQDFAAGNEEAA